MYSLPNRHNVWPTKRPNIAPPDPVDLAHKWHRVQSGTMNKILAGKFLIVMLIGIALVKSVIAMMLIRCCFLKKVKFNFFKAGADTLRIAP